MGADMELNRDTLKSYGYHHFLPLSAIAEGVQVSEVALKDETPFVALGKRNGKPVPDDQVSIPNLPSSVEYILIEGRENVLYHRFNEQLFVRCLALPKANGTVWGQHTRTDLLPLDSIKEAVDYAKGLVKSSRFEAVGFLLGLKLLDELSTEELQFRLTEDEVDTVESMVANLAQKFGLEDAWQHVSQPGKHELQKVVMAWQPYRFLAGVQPKEVFSNLSTLFHSESPENFSLGDSLPRFIQNLLLDSCESICVAGIDTTSLLDVLLTKTNTAEMIGDCHPVVERLGRNLFDKFSCADEDFLRLSQTKVWSHIICMPPFGQKIKDDEILARFELADRGRGRRSRNTDAQDLWLEQCHNLLTDPGFLIILLAEGFLSNASSRFSREWVQKNFMIDSIFSLPPSLFYPASAIKTSLVCLRKMAQPPDQYRIFMADLDEEDFDDPSAIIEAYQTAKAEEGISV